MGNLIFGTTTIEGRTFDDIKVQTSKAGVPRPIIFGKVLPVIGNIIATTAPKIVKKKEKQKSGKGGGSTEVVNEEVYRTYAIRICEGPITGISRVWRNNELIYDRDSTDTTQIQNNNAFLLIADFFLGDWDQMPSAVMQAAFGTSEVHAYRGTCYMVIDNENLTSTGGAIPQFAFEVERAEGNMLTSRPYAVEVTETLSSSCRTKGLDFINYFEHTTEDAMTSGCAIEGGELRNLLNTHSIEPEGLAASCSLNAGEMRNLLKAYSTESEGLNSSCTLGGGTMGEVLIEYDRAEVEGLISACAPISGEMQ
ncbi:hypothetical protein ACJJIE_02630 [Microbulbifer sp. TRSA001]|uniref:hypothetical protein n=1 Tax=Microbulbifer sp. TRSA001 TaxID=3243381 RepID=UPI004039879E